jgi:hypothetical protein
MILPDFSEKKYLPKGRHLSTFTVTFIAPVNKGDRTSVGNNNDTLVLFVT